MTNDTIGWCAVRRDQLLDILLGAHAPSEVVCTSTPPAVGSEFLILGRSIEIPRGDDHVALIILPDLAFGEMLSWLRVYTPDCWPLTQFARVTLMTDWMRLKRSDGDSWEQRIGLDRWASLAVGEVLAQPEGEAQLGNIPFLRLQGCLSTAVGRAETLHRSAYASQTCISRLRNIERDPRFSRRALTLDKLVPVWDLLRGVQEPFFDAIDAVSYVLVHSSEVSREAASVSVWFTPERLVNSTGFGSDSLEERVLAFEKLTIEVTAWVSQVPGKDPSVVLAAGAFLVGRGTSHIFLLRRFSKFAPTAPVWFAAMAALTGPPSWDGTWLRNVKGAEKLLRVGFGWAEPSSADLCWPEYAWLAEQFQGIGAFSEVPRMMPRSISIEIIPGVVHHVRMLGMSEQEGRQEPDSVREQKLQEAVAQLAHVTARIRELTGHPSSGVSASGWQQALPLTDSPESYRKRPKSRKERKE